VVEGFGEGGACGRGLGEWGMESRGVRKWGEWEECLGVGGVELSYVRFISIHCLCLSSSWPLDAVAMIAEARRFL